jgi:hypothetical protein
MEHCFIELKNQPTNTRTIWLADLIIEDCENGILITKDRNAVCKNIVTDSGYPIHIVKGERMDNKQTTDASNNPSFNNKKHDDKLDYTEPTMDVEYHYKFIPVESSDNNSDLIIKHQGDRLIFAKDTYGAFTIGGYTHIEPENKLKLQFHNLTDKPNAKTMTSVKQDDKLDYIDAKQYGDKIKANISNAMQIRLDELGEAGKKLKQFLIQTADKITKEYNEAIKNSKINESDTDYHFKVNNLGNIDFARISDDYKDTNVLLVAFDFDIVNRVILISNNLLESLSNVKCFVEGVRISKTWGNSQIAFEEAVSNSESTNPDITSMKYHRGMELDQFTDVEDILQSLKQGMADLEKGKVCERKVCVKVYELKVR